MTFSASTAATCHIRSMSEKERDQEIERLQKTKKWIALGEQE
jgi:hypothetical protein